jgi:hypothetical protein
MKRYRVDADYISFERRLKVLRNKDNKLIENPREVRVLKL